MSLGDKDFQNKTLHGEKIIRFFPIFDVAKVRYFGTLAIHPTLYDDGAFDCTDNDHTVCNESPE